MMKSRNGLRKKDRRKKRNKKKTDSRREFELRKNRVVK